MQNIKKILYLLTPSEQKHAAKLLLMTLFMSLIDIVGVASILPFIAVLTNPELIETNIFLNKIYIISNSIGVKNYEHFFIFLGLIVLLFLVLSLIFRAVTFYLQSRFVQIREYTIGKKLIEKYLNQPYEWFLDRNSADFGKTILSEVNQLVVFGINPLFELISKSIVAITLLILLIIVDVKLAFIVTFVLGGTYGLIFYFVKNYLNRIGKIRLLKNNLRFTTVIEAFRATKVVKLHGLENSFIKRFSNPAESFALTSASSMAVGNIPRFIIELIAFGGIMLVILYMMIQNGSFSDSLPIISLYAFAGYRLMPALQQIYSSLTGLTFVGPSLEKIYNDLKNLQTTDTNNHDQNIKFNKVLTLENIYYDYPNSSKTTLSDINLSINARTMVGFIGATGSGKTTIVDIILGLIKGQKGSLRVDKEIISKKNLRAWQKLIGYVPQQIYLADSTIAANIAFGKENKDINLELVERASKIANLHKFVMDELPNQYQTPIGENGIRLSGGQRQRIGIARALYHNPKLLVFDEATSSLDNQTEQAVMDAVNNLNEDITIILIAHRLNTLKDCDVIYRIEKGKIVDCGNFDTLIKNKKSNKIEN
jgi:ATP-binding cassette, subfamily B, bacterial PglK